MTILFSIFSSLASGTILSFVNRWHWRDTAEGKGLAFWFCCASSAGFCSRLGSRSARLLWSTQLLHHQVLGPISIQWPAASPSNPPLRWFCSRVPPVRHFPVDSFPQHSGFPANFSGAADSDFSAIQCAILSSKPWASVWEQKGSFPRELHLSPRQGLLYIILCCIIYSISAIKNLNYIYFLFYLFFQPLEFFFFAAPLSLWDLSSATRDQDPCSGSTVLTTGPPGKSLDPILGL